MKRGGAASGQARASLLPGPSDSRSYMADVSGGVSPSSKLPIRFICICQYPRPSVPVSAASRDSPSPLKYYYFYPNYSTSQVEIQVAL
ncbi:hypothetical protein ACRRTK_019183 [Alexandromys fortis]